MCECALGALRDLFCPLFLLSPEFWIRKCTDHFCADKQGVGVVFSEGFRESVHMKKFLCVSVDCLSGDSHLESGYRFPIHRESEPMGDPGCFVHDDLYLLK